jgi:outer membrane protein assembly factor BamB
MMKRMFLMSLCVLCIAQISSENEDWPQLGRNAQHTFFSDTVIPHQLEIVWQYHVEPESEYHSRERFCPLSCPAVVGDRAYILDFSTLYCLSLPTGRVLYEVPAYSIYPYTPAVVDGKVYGASERNLFRCIDAYTGMTVWERELLNLHTVSPVVDDDTVYVTADHSSSFHRDVSPCGWMATEWSTLVAMDKETGEDIWRYSVADLPAAASGIGFPVLADDSIFFYAKCFEEVAYWDEDPERSGLVCLNARTGAFKWICEGVLISSPTEVGGLSPLWMAYYEDKIYFCVNGYTLCLDIETLNPLWEYTVKGWSPLSVGNGMVVVSGWTQVSCLDAETGKELWVLPIGSSASAMTENEVFIGWGENLYRVNIGSGEIITSYTLDGSVYSPAAAHGYVLVGTSENRIYCLGQSGRYRTVCALAALGAVIVVLVFLRRARSRT